MAQTPDKSTDDSGTINWHNVLVDPDAAREMLKPFVGSKNKIALISKALVRYEGLLRSVSSTSYQINLLSGTWSSRTLFTVLDSRSAELDTDGRIIQFQLDSWEARTAPS